MWRKLKFTFCFSGDAGSSGWKYCICSTNPSTPNPFLKLHSLDTRFSLCSPRCATPTLKTNIYREKFSFPWNILNNADLLFDSLKCCYGEYVLNQYMSIVFSTMTPNQQPWLPHFSVSEWGKLWKLLCTNSIKVFKESQTWQVSALLLLLFLNHSAAGVLLTQNLHFLQETIDVYQLLYKWHTTRKIYNSFQLPRM